MQLTGRILLRSPGGHRPTFLAVLRAEWIGIAVLLMACGAPVGTPTGTDRSPAPSSTSSLSPTPAPSTPTPDATLEPTPAAIGNWRELPGEPVPYLHDLVGRANGFIGVGRTSDPQGAGPAVWRSADGRAWTEVPIELEAELDPEVLESLYVLTADDRLVAISGTAALGVAESEDGRTWTYVSPEQDACPADLAAHDKVVVAVGGVGPCQMGGFGQPGAWVSVDPADWTNAWPETGPGFLHGVVATAGGFVAWGTVAEDADSLVCEIGCFVDPVREPYAGAPWFSTDGASWQRLTDPAPFAGATIEGMATAEQGTLAIGWAPSADAPQLQEIRAWMSNDGASWALLDIDPPFGGVEPGMGIGIGGGPSGFAVWTQSVPGVTTMVWASVDGRSWDAGTELPVAMLHGVESLGEGLIAYGTVEDADSGISVPCDKDDVVEGRCRTVPAVWILDRVP